MKLIFILVLVSLCTAFVAAGPIRVPTGRPVMIDGRCPADEWDGSEVIRVNDQYRLLFKKTPDYLFICIDGSRESNLMMDLYFSPSDHDLYTFHASAKLGERKLTGEQWEEFRTDWNWWEISGWTANTRRFNSQTEPRFLLNKAVEYQISRRQFGGRRWRVMFDFLGVATPILYPLEADKLDRRTWLELSL